MLISYIFLGVSLLNSLHDFHVSTEDCDEPCEDPPVFTPSRLVVKHGDPTGANCSVCQHCNSTSFGLEKNLGSIQKNGFLISWTVDKMTEWSSNPMCYYSVPGSSRQCCSKLPITVYKLPDNVSLNINKSREWYEGQNLTMECSVQNVAPVKNLRVTFYSGRGKLGQKKYNSSTAYRPGSEKFELDFSPTKEDDGVQFWCEAELLLGPEGPQPPPVVKSPNFSATVLYKPRFMVASPPNPIIVKEGNPVRLDCSAVGNPSPRYTWTVPSGVSPTNSGVLIIKSTTTEDKGQYTCVVSNSEGTVTARFDVDVQRDYTIIIIVVAVIGFLLFVSLAGFIFFKCYKKNRKGQYNLKDVFRFHKQHSLVPTAL